MIHMVDSYRVCTADEPVMQDGYITLVDGGAMAPGAGRPHPLAVEDEQHEGVDVHDGQTQHYNQH